MKKIRLVTALSLALLLVGCKTSYKERRELQADKEAYCEQLFAASTTGSSFSSKGTVAITYGGESLSSKATFDLQRDKAIQISVRPLLGIELFKVQLTPDTVLVIDRTKRRYLLEALDQLPIPFPFPAVQALLLGQPSLLGLSQEVVEELPEMLNMKPTVAGGYEISYTDHPSFQLLLTGSAESRVEQLRIIATGDEVGYSSWSYSGYNNTTQPAALPNEVNVMNDMRGYQLGFTLKYTTPSWNNNTNITLSIPTNYSRMGIKELLNMLSK